MQKKILRTTALLLCFCILLLAVPNTFAKGEKRSRFDSSKSRFFFVNPGDLMNNVLLFLTPHFNFHQTDKKGTLRSTNQTAKSGKSKLTGDLNQCKVNDD
jgi:hypothetical protein